MKRISVILTLTLVLCLISPAAAAADNSSRIPPAGLNEKVLQAREINEDSAGWIYVPGTKIDGVVLKGPDNQFYLRRNFNKEEDFDGCNMMDYRCDSTPGKLPRSTVIYGHSNSDDPNGDNFSQLKRYLDDKFAKKNPYVYYSDGQNTYTFQIFAVYKVNIIDPDMPYNVPTIDDATMERVLKTAESLSVREYKYQPSAGARILTLSTSVYTVDESETVFPASYYRFVVMAKAIVNPYVAQTAA